MQLRFDSIKAEEKMLSGSFGQSQECLCFFISVSLVQNLFFFSEKKKKITIQHQFQKNIVAKCEMLIGFPNVYNNNFKNLHCTIFSTSSIIQSSWDSISQKPEWISEKN